MQPIWSLFLVAIAFFVILHLRNRKKRPRPEKVYARRISGSQVVIYLHPRVSGECLLDHGMQFGAGFRRKGGAQLPHDDTCRCRTVEFSYTSTEVFNGALRRGVSVGSTIAGLGPNDARQLIERLRQASERPLPHSEADYLAAMELDEFPAVLRDSLESFLHERYSFLRQGSAGPAAEPLPAGQP